MKNRKFARPIIAGLSIALLSGAAYAYGSGGHGHKMGKGGCDGRSGQHEQGHKQRGGMMQLPSAVIEELSLTETQKAAFFDAQTASQAMRDSMRASMRQAREERKTAAESEPFDPRQMFEQRDTRMQQMQQARQQIQQQWLGFWDSLSTEQQAVVQNYMQTKAKNKMQDHNQHKGQGKGKGMGQGMGQQRS